MKSNKSVLIVGANSLLSINIINQLKMNNEYSFSITGVYNKNVNNLKRIDLELISYNSLIKSTKTYDFVFIVAAHIPYQNPNLFDDRLIDKNIKLVSETSKKNKTSKLIFCSSVSIYGSTDETITEHSLPNPNNAYAISKLAGENICKLHQKYSIVRLSSLYGKGIETPTFIPRAISQAKQNNEIIIYGNGKRLQNYIHVADAANLIIKSALYSQNGIFLGVSSKEHSNVKIGKLIAKNSKNKVEIIFKGIDASANSIYNCKQTIEKLKISSEIDIEDGIKEMMV